MTLYSLVLHGNSSGREKSTYIIFLDGYSVDYETDLEHKKTVKRRENRSPAVNVKS